MFLINYLQWFNQPHSNYGAKVWEKLNVFDVSGSSTLGGLNYTFNFFFTSYMIKTQCQLFLIS